MTTEAAQLPAVIKPSLVDLIVPKAMAVVPSPTSDFWYQPAGYSTAGTMVTPQTALTYSGCWCATNAIAGFFGAMPLKVYKKTSTGRDEAINHPLSRILGRELNASTDSYIGWEMLTHWWVNYGNAYAEKQYLDASKRIYALWPIHPSRVKDEVINNELTGRYIVRGNNGTDVIFEEDEIFNIVGNLSEDGRRGKGIFTYGANAIGTGLAQSKYESDFYAKGGRPAGILKHPNTLSDQARADMRREWRTIHQEGNEIAILWEGMQYEAISIDPEHSKLKESEIGTIQDMCRFYDLPPHVLYELSNGTFANTEEMNRFLVSHPMNRRIVRVEKAIDRQLFSEEEKKAGYYVKFNVKFLMRGTPKEQAELNAINFQNGFINQDEVRAQDELNPLPDGQGKSYWVRRDLATVDHVLASQSAAAELAAVELETAKNPPEPTPPKPDTPPTPDPANIITVMTAGFERLLAVARPAVDSHEARELEEITAKCGELQSKLTQAESAVAELLQEKTGLNARIEALEGENSAIRLSETTVRGELSELEASVSGLRDELGQLQSERQTHMRNLDAAKADIESANRDREIIEQQCIALDGKTKALETDLQVANQAKTDSEATISKLSKQNTSLEGMLSKANSRGDELKAKVESMATELGTARAERETFSQHVSMLTKSRDEVYASLSDTKKELETANARTESALQAVADAKSGAERQVAASRGTIAASVRTLLNESLQFLLSQEQHEARGAVRRPDQFKQLMSEYYGRFEQSLHSQLQQAALAMEATGAEPVDVSKLAAKYSADSLTALNKLFHGTKRDDLRVAVRKETESWEGRRQSLTDWIGE